MRKIRKITVDGRNYYWSIDGNEIYNEGKSLVVVLENTSYSRLYINPYAHDFEIRPKVVAEAIGAARMLGWKPEENSGDMYIMSEDGLSFERQTIS